MLLLLSLFVPYLVMHCIRVIPFVTKWFLCWCRIGCSQHNINNQT